MCARDMSIPEKWESGNAAFKEVKGILLKEAIFCLQMVNGEIFGDTQHMHPWQRSK